MKKIIIILTLLVFGFVSMYAQGAQAAQTSQGTQENQGEEYIAPIKNSYWGFNVSFGLSRLSLLENSSYYKSAGPGFNWGIHLNTTYYLSGSPIGINVSLGFEQLSGIYSPYSADDVTMKSTLMPLHIGLAVRSGNIFINAGVVVAAQFSLKGTQNGYSVSYSDKRTGLYGFYLNAGYRVALGKTFIPIGLEFTYYFSSVAQSTTSAKWLQINLKIGIEM